MYDLIIIGGGAAGIYGAIAAKQANPTASVLVLEKSQVLLAKVKVSGGGRCNVTHACFDPRVLVQNYPRGYKELLGPFHQFQPKDTIAWFAERGVELKTETDGRMFPVTNSSSTIIDCLLNEAKRLGVEIQLRQKVANIEKEEEGFSLYLKEGPTLKTQKLLLATGSSAEGHLFARSLGHSIEEPVPSLFTFNIPDFPLSRLSGISHQPVKVSLPGTTLAQTGPVLITHFGLSGPAVLKLSAWAARYLHDCDYKAEVILDWLPDKNEEAIFQILRLAKQEHPQKMLSALKLFPFANNLWKAFLEEIGEKMLSNVPDKALRLLASRLHRDSYQIQGKTTHKEEFVTCGGVSLTEVDFKNLQSKLCPGLYFAGEILDVDGVTGGFNFQNAWTTAHIAGTKSVTER